MKECKSGCGCIKTFKGHDGECIFENVTIQNAMLEEIYIKADKIAKEAHRMNTSDRNAWYVTLEELMNILKSFEE